jgi:hypothetical protein
VAAAREMQMAAMIAREVVAVRTMRVSVGGAVEATHPSTERSVD